VENGHDMSSFVFTVMLIYIFASLLNTFFKIITNPKHLTIVYIQI